MQGKPEWKKHETGPFGEYLYTQEDYHKLRARLATYEAALREIANIPEGDDYVDSDRDLMIRLNDARALARKALKDNT